MVGLPVYFPFAKASTWLVSRTLGRLCPSCTGCTLPGTSLDVSWPSFSTLRLTPRLAQTPFLCIVLCYFLERAWGYWHCHLVCDPYHYWMNQKEFWCYGGNQVNGNCGAFSNFIHDHPTQGSPRVSVSFGTQIFPAVFWLLLIAIRKSFLASLNILFLSIVWTSSCCSLHSLLVMFSSTLRFRVSNSNCGLWWLRACLILGIDASQAPLAISITWPDLT